jgi:nucleoid-associated protein YgaU
MSDNQDQHADLRTGDNRRRRPLFYLLGAAALMGAGYFGYWTAIDPPSPVENAVVGKTTEPATAAPDPALAAKPTMQTEAAPATAQPPEAPKATEAAAPEAKPAEPVPEPTQQAAIQPQAAAPAAAVNKETTPATAPEATPEAAPETAAPIVQAIAPSFDTVRVEPDGAAIIAGRAKPGSEVLVKHNGAVIGKVTANSEGSFVFVPDKPLPAGTGALTLETQDGGTLMSSAESVAIAIKEQAQGEALVAVVKPDEPVAVVQAPSSGTDSSPSGKVVLDSVDYDDKGNIVFSGRSMPGNTIRLYVDNALAGEVQSDAQGKWTFNGRNAIAAGTHTLRADEVDSADKVISRVELPFQREEAAKVAAVQPGNASAGKSAIGVKTGGSNAVPQRVIIQPGNNLWRLSRLVYGKGTQFTVIYEANKDQIRNPDLIYPGQVFSMPLKQ